MNEIKKLDQIVTDSYDLVFGKVFEDAFDNFKKIVGTAGVAILLLTIITSILCLGIFGALFGLGTAVKDLANFNISNYSTTIIVGALIAGVLFGILSAIITAGFIEMCHKADKNENFGVGTIFTHFSSSFFKELAIFGVIISGGSIILAQALNIYANGLGSLLSYIISFFTFLSIPLIIFSNCTALQAISYSFKLVLKQPIIIFGLLLITAMLACAGIIALCIGVFFTISLLYSMYYTIYRTIVPSDNTSIIDEIGTNFD